MLVTTPDTLATHPQDTLHTLSTHPRLTPSQHALSTRPFNTPSSHALATHPRHTPSQILTNNTPSQILTNNTPSHHHQQHPLSSSLTNNTPSHHHQQHPLSSSPITPPLIITNNTLDAPKEKRFIHTNSTNSTNSSSSNQQLSLPMIQFYMASVVTALAHLHKHCIAYRNLKPEHVLIDGKGYIKLIGTPHS